MSMRDEDRRRHDTVKASLAETQRKIARLHGKMEATYETLPQNEAIIADVMKETGASRERVVQSLQAISERELAALRAEEPASSGLAQEGPLDPAVKRFREMLT